MYWDWSLWIDHVIFYGLALKTWIITWIMTEAFELIRMTQYYNKQYLYMIHIFFTIAIYFTLETYWDDIQCFIATMPEYEPTSVWKRWVSGQFELRMYCIYTDYVPVKTHYNDTQIFDIYSLNCVIHILRDKKKIVYGPEFLKWTNWVSEFTK